MYPEGVAHTDRKIGLSGSLLPPACIPFIASGPKGLPHGGEPRPSRTNPTPVSSTNWGFLKSWSVGGAALRSSNRNAWVHEMR